MILNKTRELASSRFSIAFIFAISGWVVAAVLLIVLLLTWRANSGRTRPELAAGTPPAEAPASAAPAPTLMTVYVRPHSDSFSRGRWIRFWRYEKRSDGTVAFAGPDGAMTVDSSAVDWPGVKRAIE